MLKRIALVVVMGLALLLGAACGPVPQQATTAPGAGDANAGTGSEAADTAKLPEAEAVSPEAPAPPAAGTTVKVTLPIEPRKLEVAPGLVETVWTFGGRVPGPVIRVHQGDTVEVTLVNKDTIAHSIDFHAARVAPDRAFADVAPGESRTVTFRANDPGVFMYHCGTAPVLMHIAMGMYGMLIVDPKDGRTDAREFSLVQSEMYKNMDMQAMTAGQAAAVVFNGRADQYKENPLKVKVGEPVRLYVVNAGPDHFSAFHVVGTIFDRVEPDGNPKNAQYGVSTYTLAPGGGAVFETHFDEPGKYPFVTHSFGDATLGAIGVIEVTP